MNDINWNQFMLKNSNPQDAFETICRNLFLREYKVSSHSFSSNYNQIGLETEPVYFEEKYYGFQCKYSESGNEKALYKQVYDSLCKAINLYSNLNVVIIYTNLDIKPNVSKKELEESKETNRIKIYKLGIEHDLEIKWFLKPNFEQALNEVKNYDLYRSFFSSQDLRGMLNDALTHDERTFLQSDQFIDLTLNDAKYSSIKEEIVSQKISMITGPAGTGKSEILKHLYLQCEKQYLLNMDKVSSDGDLFIPIFIRMRECINGDLESLLRNRLNDFEVNIVNPQNHYVYFFDGIDEISALDFSGVITCMMRLKGKDTTQGFILSSRTNTANLTTVLRDLNPNVYKIEPLTSSDVVDYFNRLNSFKKISKLQEIKANNLPFFEDITDIFSVVLLNNNIFQINNTMTKVDLIELNVKKLIENNKKYTLINLPEPKMVSIQRILGQTSELMQRTGNISINRSDLQRIVTELFPRCSYVQIDEIIDFISEIFFDSSSVELNEKRYSFRHKRYFEFYLYIAIKDTFYDNPAILRDLSLLSNKDFIINIFLAQELKNSHLNNNIQHVLMLRFLETYLGETYFDGFKILWKKSEAPLVLGADSYLQSQQLLEYLCTKNFNDLGDFVNNDPLFIKSFLTKDNYYSFVKQYHEWNGSDIRGLLNKIYDIGDEWRAKAAQKDPASFLYCKCVIDQELISEVYNDIKTIENVRINDLDSYPYNSNNANIIVDFFELALNHYSNWLVSIIEDISINHLEVLSFTLLRTHNLRHIVKFDGGFSPIAEAINNRINNSNTQSYGVHTVVLYSVLTGDSIQKEDIQVRSESVNIYHYETWRRNFDLNNYVGVVLGDEFRPYHYDYSLGITLRKIVNDYDTKSKGQILPTILQEVNRYNFVCKNWFSYHNAVFIGETIATLDIDNTDIKQFIIKLSNFDSVVSTFQVLYTIMRKNVELFKAVANPNLITSAYAKASQNLSYYDYNSELAFMYATMISFFDIVKADALFEVAINNSIFRPIFRKENMLDFYLSNCLLIAYNNCWLSNDQMESFVRRVHLILKIAKDTLDSGAYGEHFKYLVEQCCPQLSGIIQDINVDAVNPDVTTDWESCSSRIKMENVKLDNLSKYYSCEIEDVNYLSISVWKNLIEFELEKDSELTILYQTLERNYYPGLGTTKVSRCFHVIVAVLISNAKTKTKAIEFIIEHSGRMGLIHLISAFALVGDDDSGRRYLEALIKMCEAMVYPSSEYSIQVELDNSKEKLIDIICNSKSTDWEEDSDRHVMCYSRDSKLSIRWDPSEEQERFYEKWAIKHPDKNAFCTRYYLYCQEELLKTFDMVWVDGYRALIPMPKHINNHIDRRSYNLACIVNSSVDNLNNYILSCGLIVD